MDRLETSESIKERRREGKGMRGVRELWLSAVQKLSACASWPVSVVARRRKQTVFENGFGRCALTMG
jgi:hypothetical protein